VPPYPWRLRAAVRQVADFIRNHRKPHAGFAGTRGFHRGVQCQDVSLERDLTMTRMIFEIFSLEPLISFMDCTISPRF